MKFTLTIDLGNEAMQTPHDVAGVLLRLSQKFTAEYVPWEKSDAYDTSGTVRDTNGNRVGRWEVGE